MAHSVESAYNSANCLTMPISSQW